MRPSELQWMYGGGAGMLRPRAWSSFLAHLPPEERSCPLAAYHARLMSPDPAIRDAAVSGVFCGDDGFN
jgi:proline iminopeptidase